MAKITIQGLVATTPRHLVTQEGLPITSFRFAEDNDGTEISNWFTVIGFRQLAVNMADSIQKGARIVVTGNLKVRDWDNGERAGTSVEIEAESVGFDLNHGTAEFKRNQPAPVETQHACDCPNCDK